MLIPPSVGVTNVGRWRFRCYNDNYDSKAHSFTFIIINSYSESSSCRDDRSVVEPVTVTEQQLATLAGRVALADCCYKLVG